MMARIILPIMRIYQPHGFSLPDSSVLFCACSVFVGREVNESTRAGAKFVFI